MASGICFRFYEELNDFLPPQRRKTTFCVPSTRRASVKNWIEALGVPHTEVDLVLANGEAVDFGYIPRPGDRISAYPRFERLNIAALTRLRPRPLRRLRFVADAHLGKLALYLRMMGFDTLYSTDWSDSELARLAQQQHRVLLSRDRGLLKRRAVEHGYRLQSERPRAQLIEVLRRFDLADESVPFSRCLRCNTPLETLTGKDFYAVVPEPVRREHRVVRRCPSCGRLYWQGSHVRRMQAFIAAVCADSAAGNG